MNINLPPHLSLRIGLLTKKAMRLRGGGSALPGLVTETIDPRFLSRTLGKLPLGVVVISGTNGKTTTTKMVAQLLRAEGLKVFTNPSGSNFTRGIVASLLDQVDPASGSIDADIAVLELDEAHAVHFIRQVKPRYSLILNVLRDQLDRFGEIDHTARLLGEVTKATTKGVVLNREDPLVRSLAVHARKKAEVRYFGLGADLRKHFPSDNELRGAHSSPAVSEIPRLRSTDTILSAMEGKTATFSFGKRALTEVELKLDGIYNVLNAAAALAMARMIRSEEIDEASLLKELGNVKPAFGRGEALEIDGHPLEIVLVKNPSGFRLALSSYAERPAHTMIAINDKYADGRDMSWLWDVDFDSLQAQTGKQRGVSVVSGIRAYDMGLRLQYDQVAVGHIDTDIAKALAYFLRESTGPKRIYCTYTAMLQIRRQLSKSYHLEPIE